MASGITSDDCPLILFWQTIHLGEEAIGISEQGVSIEIRQIK